MGSLKKVPPEGGAGGRRGHSGMEHWAHTDEIKDAARGQRRKTDRRESGQGAAEAELVRRLTAAWERVVADCGCDDVYYCPASDEIECSRHGGFDTCCGNVQDHLPAR